MANKITALLDLDATKFKAGVKATQQSIKETEGSINKVKAGWKSMLTEFTRSPAAIAGAGVAAGAFAAKAISDASDLEESINAVRVTFSDAADDVLKLGENASTSFGLAKSEFNQLAVQFSSFAQNIAAGTGQSVDSVLGDLTTRVADFASVLNLDLSEATQVFMSSLAGETEPIRRFGKDLSAAAVEAFALENGLIKTKDQLTESIKIQARYGLLMQQTSDAAGDFANTSDSLANKQRILAAQAKDASAQIGKSLLPAVTAVVNVMSDGAPIIEDFSSAVTGLADELQKLPGGKELFGTNVFELLGTLGSEVKNSWMDLGRAVGVVGEETREATQDGIDGWAMSKRQAEAYVQTLNAMNAATRADSWEKNRAAAEGYAEALERAGQAQLDLQLSELVANVEDVRMQTDGLAAEMDDYARAAALAELNTRLVDKALAGLSDTLDAEAGLLELEDQLDRVREAEAAIGEAAGEGADEVEDAQRRHRQEVIRTQQMVIRLLETYDDIPVDKVTEIIAKINTGDIDEIEDALDMLTEDRTVRISVIAPNIRDAFRNIDLGFNPWGGGGGSLAPIYNNSTPETGSGDGPLGLPGNGGGFSSQSITINTLTSSPARQYVDRVVDDRRNGIR